MKCPYCNSDMQEGYIQCRDGVYWSNKKRLISAIAPLNNESIKLANGEGPFAGSCVIAYNCSYCKKIMIDYNNH